MTSSFWLIVVFLLAVLYLPFGAAAYCWHLWNKCQSRRVRIVSYVLFWVLILWVLGWFLQYFYVTHIWYSWEAQGGFPGFEGR